MKTDRSYHVVELDKGIKSEIPVYQYNNHRKVKCPFHIEELHITNIFENEEDADAGEAVVDVLGCFRREFTNLAIDNTVYFVYGDIVVPAKSGMESVYEATILPNLPGGVKFFVSLDGVKAASQVMKFRFPSKPARSEAERDLEERLAHLLLFNKEDHQELLSRLRQCDNKDTHTEIVLREFLHEWIFDDRKSAYSLDDEGCGVIHLVASLGYAWAIGILGRLQFILDFKDAFGSTPLHWASFHGRSVRLLTYLLSFTSYTVLNLTHVYMFLQVGWY
ncbi:hypothetical protein MKW92_052732 [Papaver armeniacum]|nr:hypothetical protein MKW92_052732 [Papaver armeniacum]